jgi:hypothetical protein
MVKSASAPGNNMLKPGMQIETLIAQYFTGTKVAACCAILVSILLGSLLMAAVYTIKL